MVCCVVGIFKVKKYIYMYRKCFFYKIYVSLLGLVLVTNITIAITNGLHLDGRTTNGGTRTTIALAVRTNLFRGSSLLRRMAIN